MVPFGRKRGRGPGGPPDLPFPQFRYHPDPIGSGSVAESEEQCLACGHRRGHIYTGPTYSVHELEQALCPWCIADGSAARRFEAEFTSVDNAPPGIAEATLDEILTRTPGFSGWQEEEWLFHCGDGAAFLGPAGRDDLEPYPDAIEAIRRENAGIGWSEEDIDGFIAALRKGDASPTAYLFRCLHCGVHLAYTDFD